MDSTHKSTEISPEEKEKREITTNENSRTTRSYDCAFCKRGFTNAQALGGHMNIHRKDKDKAKKLRESTVAHKAYEYISPISSEQAQFYAALRANKSYEFFATSPNAHFPHAYNPQIVFNQDFLTPYRDFMGTNLNLRTGLLVPEENGEKIKREELWDRNWLGNEQVDLELRLGQNP